jgi:CDP-diacylglycerol--glycerol-3-phosphate 3-phosphatidyltransferase
MLARAQIPNSLTIARIVAVPVSLLIMILAPTAYLALLVIFVAAALTDFLDGYLARKWNAQSAFGAMLDPMADKLLVALLLLYLLQQTVLSIIPVAIILLRELFIAGLRESLALRQVPLPVSRGGKIKTALQMIGIALVLLALAYPVTGLLQFGSIVIWIAAAFALVSAGEYVMGTVRAVK